MRSKTRKCINRQLDKLYSEKITLAMDQNELKATD